MRKKLFSTFLPLVIAIACSMAVWANEPAATQPGCDKCAKADKSASAPCPNCAKDGKTAQGCDKCAKMKAEECAKLKAAGKPCGEAGCDKQAKADTAAPAAPGCDKCAKMKAEECAKLKAAGKPCGEAGCDKHAKADTAVPAAPGCDKCAKMKAAEAKPAEKKPCCDKDKP